MIPKYRLIERTAEMYVENRIVCEGDLQLCLDTLFNCEASNIDSATDPVTYAYIIERIENERRKITTEQF